MKPILLKFLLTILPVVAITTSLQAASWYVDNGNLTSQSEVWNAGTTVWNSQPDGLGVAPGAPLPVGDYFLNGKTLRTGNNLIGSSTFDGGTLTIDGNGLLAVFNAAAAVVSSNTLNFAGGNVSWLNSSTLASVNSDVSNYTRLQAGAGLSVTLSITNLTGSSNIKIGDVAAHTGIYNLNFANASGYSGTFETTRGTTVFAADTNVGNAGWSVVGTGIIDLNQNITIGAMTIDSTVLNPGTYSFNQLNTDFDSRFVDGGTGSITVVPEPSTFALLLGILALGFTIRRRSQR